MVAVGVGNEDDDVLVLDLLRVDEAVGQGRLGRSRPAPAEVIEDEQAAPRLDGEAAMSEGPDDGLAVLEGPGQDRPDIRRRFPGLGAAPAWTRMSAISG